MNELSRQSLRIEIEEVSRMRDRIDRIREREVKSGPDGRIDAIDSLSEASQALLIVTGLLLRARRCQ